MKRTVFFLLLALLLLTTAARAATLPDGLAETLPDGLIEETEHSGLLSGGSDWLSRTVRRQLDGSLHGGVRSAALLTLTALICGAAQGLTGGAGEAAARCVPYCGVLAASALAAGDLRTLIGLGARTVEELSALAKLLLPALAGSMAAGGLVTAASVWQAATLMACAVLSDAAARLLLPLVYCCIAAAAAGAALDDDRIDRLAGWLVKLCSGALALSMAAFSAYLTLAGVLAGNADRAAVRVAKAAAGAVPVVGGVLSDAAEGVLAAAGTLRGTVGALGVFTILAACLVPLLRLGAQFLLYKLAAFAAGLAGTRELSRYLDRLGEAFALVFATTASCALLLLVALLVAASMASG